MGVNFINLLSEKTLKSVCFLYVKAGFAATSPHNMMTHSFLARDTIFLELSDS